MSLTPIEFKSLLKATQISDSNSYVYCQMVPFNLTLNDHKWSNPRSQNFKSLWIVQYLIHPACLPCYCLSSCLNCKKWVANLIQIMINSDKWAVSCELVGLPLELALFGCSPPSNPALIWKWSGIAPDQIEIMIMGFISWSADPTAKRRTFSPFGKANSHLELIFKFGIQSL